jgi:hypothetical protein
MPPYNDIEQIVKSYRNHFAKYLLLDHLNGFDCKKNNKILEYLNQQAALLGETFTLYYVHIIEDDVKQQYPNLDIKFNFDLQHERIWKPFSNYNIHPELKFKNFVCSFNGASHVGRKLLASALKKFRYFNSEYCSKNFSYTVDSLDGHISDYTNRDNVFYRKFFVEKNSEIFFQSIVSFEYERFDHASNIYNLEHKLAESFLHIVSECMATSYHPFVSEKFLYSVVTRGLFLAYAQPGWHAHLEKYYGFKPYTRLFNYQFDSIQNPIDRLVELMSMIAKFSMLSADDWKDLYEMETDTIEYNYEHYFSRGYLRSLEKFQ